MQSETIAIIKSTVPLLKTHGLAITQHFYQLLFERYPDLKHVFNQQNQHSGLQSSALSDAVLAYAQNIDQVDVLLPVVTRIAHKHASLGVQPEHYPLVGETLLASIQHVLGLPDEHEALTAWGEAYQQLAELFIQTEAAIYQENEEQSGGWEGFKPFEITKIVNETPSVKSFYFTPKDNVEIPRFSAGQYLGVRMKPEKGEYQQIRQYSLSHHEHFRITVKAQPNGLASNHLHQLRVGDAVDIQPPTGVFTLRQIKPKQVFIAGGVGITPLMSMVQSVIAQRQLSSDVLFIQCAKSPSEELFPEQLATLVSDESLIYKRCLEAGEGADHQGFLTKEALSAWLLEYEFTPDNTELYFCGPKPFMSAMNQHVTSLGFEPAHIHYEVFGPTKAL